MSPVLVMLLTAKELPVNEVKPEDPTVPVVTMLSPPVSILPNPDEILPEFKAPVEVKKEVNIPVPNPVPLITPEVSIYETSDPE